ncbi:MAG: antibiotic biosynthesis monooxygenase [Candidatus Dependentiae bacterium]|nr:antibiotic biosynthesis monooxygenase [Candidatus Dependentiae bacterium]
MKLYNVFLLITCLAFQNAYAMEQNNREHHIVVSVVAKAGQADNLRNALQNIQELSRQESTCLQYEVIENNDAEGHFALYERWTNKDDHALQFNKLYIQEFIEQLPTLGDVSLYIGGHDVQK